MSINFVFIVLVVLILMSTYVFLDLKGFDKKNKYVALGILLLISIIGFKYFNNMFNEIFSLNYVSVKTYLLLIVMVNAIIIYTMKRDVKLIYKIYNYVLFILLTIIFGAMISIVLGAKIKTFYIMDISNAVNLLDLSMVLTFIYLIVFLTTYVGYYLFTPKMIMEEKDYISRFKNKLASIDLSRFKVKLPIHNDDDLDDDDYFEDANKILTPYELLNYNRENKLIINGVDCDIIFCDSNKENIIKNYYILLNDVNARLVNGYTLEENLMFKDICMKLKVNNLRNIDINNACILNRISIEEYNLLKRILI